MGTSSTDSDMGKETFGTDEQGFDVSVGDGTPAVHVRAWGFWSVEVAERFSRSVLAALASARPSLVTIDAANLKPLRDVGQDAFGTVLGALTAYRIQRVVVTGSGALTKLQLRRIAKEHANGALVEFAA